MDLVAAGGNVVADDSEASCCGRFGAIGSNLFSTIDRVLFFLPSPLPAVALNKEAKGVFSVLLRLFCIQAGWDVDGAGSPCDCDFILAVCCLMFCPAPLPFDNAAFVEAEELSRFLQMSITDSRLFSAGRDGAFVVEGEDVLLLLCIDD